MKYINVSNPTYITKDLTSIRCTITLDNYSQIPFTACIDDVESYGRQIYKDLVEGKYGKILPFEPVIIEKTEKQMADEIRMIRNGALAELDSLVVNPFRFAELDEDTKNQLAVYRKKLLDITDQPNFPNTVEWPTKPSILENEKTIQDIITSTD